jgi:hypothetical protein
MVPFFAPVLSSTRGVIEARGDNFFTISSGKPRAEAKFASGSASMANHPCQGRLSCASLARNSNFQEKVSFTEMDEMKNTDT